MHLCLCIYGYVFMFMYLRLCICIYVFTVMQLYLCIYYVKSVSLNTQRGIKYGTIKDSVISVRLYLAV